MNIKIQTIKDFEGFGSGGGRGEYYYSQGMKKSENGIKTGWKLVDNGDSSEDDLPTLTDVIKTYVQGKYGSSKSMFGLDVDGNIYYSLSGITPFSLLYRPSITVGSNNNGLVCDQKNRLIYAGSRYIGMYDLSAEYSAGTVQVSNGSNAVVGTGTTFSAGMVGKRFKIQGETAFYTVASYTDATHITLTANYSGTGGSGNEYTIFSAWTDQWKDLGAEYAFAKPIELYEDWIFIGCGNKIVGINITDDSLNTEAFTLPDGFEIKTLKTNKNGVLIGASFGSKSALILWDGYSDRSIAPWIWINEILKSVVNYNGQWLVITTTQIHITNGYSIEVTKNAFPDSDYNRSSSSFYPHYPDGAAVIKDYLIIAGATGYVDRAKSGITILNLKNGLFEFIPFSNNVLYNTTGLNGGAIGVFLDSFMTLHLSYRSSNPDKRYTCKLYETFNPHAYYISGSLGAGANDKIAEGVRLLLTPHLQETSTADITFDVSVKIYDYKRIIWAYQTTKSASTELNIFTVDGSLATYAKTQVGDEITILEGDNAGQVRHIVSIDGKGTDTEVWTLDSDLPNLTNQNVFITVCPFKLIRKYSFSNADSINDLYFDIKNKIRGKKFMVKVLFENLNLPVEIHEIQFVYDDLGYF